MTVIWSGVTEEGAVVPVQVTAEGKVVAVGDGPQGDYLPTTGGNLTGDLTLGTDKITLDAADGSATFTGNIDTYDYGSDAADQGARVGNGVLYLKRADATASEVFRIVTGRSTKRVIIFSDGGATFGNGSCGFTSVGEIFFTSRGTRYKLFVSNGMVQAEEYTRQMELKEKGEQFIADKRETKPSQPEATTDDDNA